MQTYATTVFKANE